MRDGVAGIDPLEPSTTGGDAFFSDLSKVARGTDQLPNLTLELE